MNARSRMIFSIALPMSVGIAAVCALYTRPIWPFYGAAFAISVLGALITVIGKQESRKTMRQIASAFIFFALLAARMAYAPPIKTMADAGLLVGIFLSGFALTSLLPEYYRMKKTPNQSLQPTAPSGRG